MYADDVIINFARQEITAAQRAITLSAYVWDWPENIAARLTAWEQLGVERTFLTFWDPFDTLPQAAMFMR
ncbi:MAG TPA: hypothetical protein VHZ51_09215 [Ktedonobacteraceae bacterium]|nr:hypothetical protein [Ktedonobacteraceae bacterium]